ncbi:MAG: DUF4411 family protein [Chloroflexi bacterium]|nr:DUF4411 family protein [Chloroflexota bacterium]
MEYCLDTSVYTQAHRQYYAFDLAPGFWKSLKTHAENEVLISPIAVFTELAKGNDELAKWTKENKGLLFSEPNAKVVESFRQIADFINTRYESGQWIRLFLDGADPWVIAHAKAHNLIVVTMEGNKGSEEINPRTKRFIGKIKIPNMCGHFGVKCISTFELIRALKIGLG